MKKALTLILCIAILPPVFGQKLDYDHDSKWFFGLNAGAAWNTTDVKNKTILERTAMTCPVYYSLHPDIKKVITFNWK